jgi:predicted kinase
LPPWNIVLSGYPGSGKTLLARRLVAENANFLRLSVDDVRLMFYGSAEPTEDEDFVYASLASLRDLALRAGHSVILDCTTPTNNARRFLLNTKVENALRLLVVLVVAKTELERRNRERGIRGAVEAWDKTWESPPSNMPVMKFRNGNKAEFETSYFLLTELLRSEVHPYRRRFLANLFPRIR